MTITVIDFEEGAEVRVYDSLDQIGEITPGRAVWVDVETDDFAQMSQIASTFGFHELTVEDCLSPGHFPKLDDYGSYLFMILRGLKPWNEIEEIWQEVNQEPSEASATQTSVGTKEQESYTRKVAVYLSQNLIVTFRRREVAWLDALVRRAQTKPDSTLSEGTEGVAHRVIDVLVDRFTRGIGFFENVVDAFEDAALEKPDEFEIQDLFEVKRELVYLRQVARNQRSIISQLANDSTLISDNQRRRYFKDIDDHAVEIVHGLDKQIQTVISIRDSYLAVANVRLGDTMRILTVITTIAAPLNIVVGLYGMNFKAIPMLHNPYGFWFILGTMLAVAIGMLAYFRKKHWI
ncbi:MAG: magnesium transporter CorA family protein [Bdellovibrionales bacterium]|nr:magnesium transporter CorA family protein [Bdellovibrionales bacterium]